MLLGLITTTWLIKLSTASSYAISSCLRDCGADDAGPYHGGTACKCNYANHPPGCTLAPCKIGDSTETDYNCLCSEEFSPRWCVTTRCTQKLSSGITSISNNQSSTAGCSGQICKCDELPISCKYQCGDQDCMREAPCTCVNLFWPDGCTLAPCKPGDSGDGYYACECNAENHPDFCYNSPCA